MAPNQNLARLLLIVLTLSIALAVVAGLTLSATAIVPFSIASIALSSLVVGLTTTSVAAARSLFSSPSTNHDPALYRGSRQMAARLKEMHLSKDMNVFWLLLVPFAKIFKLTRYFSWREGQDLRTRVGNMARKAEFLFIDGATQEAADMYIEVEKIAKANPQVFDERFMEALQDSKAMNYLRMAETTNCVARHTSESCIVPIRGGGVHTIQEPSRMAIKQYLELLEKHPNDMAHRWMLNIAYMTVGEYPEKVPPQYLVPMDIFFEKRDFPRFRNVATEVGLDLRGLAGGAVFDDFDNDGYLEVFLSGWTLGQQVRYFDNNGDGTFTEKTEEAGLLGIVGGLCLQQADYNNDGNLDLLVLRGGWQFDYGCEPFSLLRNNGNGTFEDVTVEAGLLNFRPTQTVAWADFHNHGRLDLFVGFESVTAEFVWNVAKSKILRYVVPARVPPIPRNPCALYRNNGDGTFTNVAHEAGVDVVGLVKGVTAADYNNDGWTDIFISRFGSTNVLLRNNGRDASGKISFTDVTEEAGVSGPIFTFPCWFWDFDNDGWLDIFVGDQTERVVVACATIAETCLGKKYPLRGIYRNNRDGTFTDVTKEMGLGDKAIFPMGSNYGDLDNDGWLDFYLGTGNPNMRTIIPNRMFKNVDGRRFEEVTGPGGFGVIQKGHEVVFADVRNCGFQDVFITHGGTFRGDVAFCNLFENPKNENHWIRLQLEGTKSNRSAIGARLKVTVQTKNGTRDIYSMVTTGGSFGGNPLRRELGLGDAVALTNIEIFWPASGIRQNFKDVPMDKFFKVREGEDRLLPLELKSFEYPAEGSRAQAHHCCGTGHGAGHDDHED